MHVLVLAGSEYIIVRDIVLIMIPALFMGVFKAIDHYYYKRLASLFEKIRYPGFRNEYLDLLDRVVFPRIFTVIAAEFSNLIKKASNEEEEKKIIIDFIEKLKRADYAPPEEFSEELESYVIARKDLTIIDMVYSEMEARRRKLIALQYLSPTVSILLFAVYLAKHEIPDLLIIAIYLAAIMFVPVLPSPAYKKYYNRVREILETTYYRNTGASDPKALVETIIKNNIVFDEDER